MAFPDGEELPAEAAEGSAGAFVAGGVALDFGEPVALAGGGDAEGTAGMSVPEAAVDEDDFLEAGGRRGRVRRGGLWRGGGSGSRGRGRCGGYE